jgi:adenosylcobinamide-GDP ribazoletransferase
MMKNFVNAIQFLTIVRVSKKHVLEEGDLAKSMLYFPLIGFLLGVILIYADKVFRLIVLPDPIGNVLLVLLMVLLTRALHIDGLADTFDGLMGGKCKDSRLAIMKDSRIGTAGVLGIVFILLLKYLCLNSLVNSEKIAALLVAPMLARWSQVIMAFEGNYGRQEGMAKAFVGHLRTSGLAYASLFAIGLTAFVIAQEEARAAFLICGAIGGVVLLTLSARWYFARKLGGLTGDVIGAVNELNEVLVLLLFVIFAGIG